MYKRQVVRSVFRWFGAERVCLISDSMRAAGMPNGVYSLGGQTVYMTDGKATLEDGTIAGSATCLAECFRRAVSFGVPLDAALRAATINPAQAVGLFDELGKMCIRDRYASSMNSTPPTADLSTCVVSGAVWPT